MKLVPMPWPMRLRRLRRRARELLRTLRLRILGAANMLGTRGPLMSEALPGIAVRGANVFGWLAMRNDHDSSTTISQTPFSLGGPLRGEPMMSSKVVRITPPYYVEKCR